MKSKFISKHKLSLLKNLNFNFCVNSKNPKNPFDRTLQLEKDIAIKKELKHSPFTHRHIGPNSTEISEMLKICKENSIEDLIKKTVPSNILLTEEQSNQQNKLLGEPLSEQTAINFLKEISKKNILNKNYIGGGYNPVFVPPVVLRNVLENPVWYTSYTPYQAEISQGRLESLLNFQTLITELTGLPFTNASLLDEATAASEAMLIAFNFFKGKRTDFFVAKNTYPFIKDILRSKAYFLNINVIEGDPHDEQILNNENLFGGIVQNPDSTGKVQNFSKFAEKLKANKSIAIISVDIASLLLTKSPKEMGFDIAVGSAQRFGVPMMNGGPHAGFMATKDEFKRIIPGRIVGVSKDKFGKTALRLSLQTREQHIKRDKATSNICTAQALLANMSAFYAIFHGKIGLIDITKRINLLAMNLQSELEKIGYEFVNKNNEIFDTITFNLEKSEFACDKIINFFISNGINLRKINENMVSLTLNETTTLADIEELMNLFYKLKNKNPIEISDFPWVKDSSTINENEIIFNKNLKRENLQEILHQDIFNKYSSESQILRYIHYLQNKDISLCNSMIALGSCTMKLNAVSELIPVSWPEFANIHPFSNPDQQLGYKELIDEFITMLKSITQFDSVSLQPNSGASGEYVGLIAIRRYQASIGQGNRNICLIPSSAHGTNPASAVISGMKVVVVSCDQLGNINVEDLKAKAELHKDNLSALMVTYPSTHGVFEASIKEINEIIHKNGGQVYMDGANMNAQVLITSPATIGADVCHLNLHKTFCIPHGGGGPGVGPICVKKHLEPFLPGHFEFTKDEKMNWGQTSAPFGSVGIISISYMYIKMLGKDLLKSTQISILNANYMMERLKDYYPILYKGNNGKIGHEFIIDIRGIKKTSGIKEEDLCKRLIDYGFHAPTMSFPVPGTVMIEPTESEDKAELDRFCDALIEIRKEIKEIEEGKQDSLDNVLKNAPHTMEEVCGTEWNHGYSREKAAFPLPYVKKRGKFWPSVARVNNEYGDLNVVCTCPSINDYI